MIASQFFPPISLQFTIPVKSINLISLALRKSSLFIFLKIMSSSRGNTSRNRPQKYQNKTAYKNDLHDTSHKTKLLNTLEVSGVCKRCKDIIEWKIKYKKYKPLATPKKCTECEQKAIKHAYHLLCGKCASDKKVCAKCCKSFEDIQLEDEQINSDLQGMLKGISERKRRTILRFIKKQQNGEMKITPEIKSQVENILDGMSSVSLDDNSDDLFVDDECKSEDGNNK